MKGKGQEIIHLEVQIGNKTLEVKARVNRHCPCPISQAFCNWRDAEYKSGNYHAWNAKLIRGW